MHVYVKYDKRHPNLPIAVADSAAELAHILGIKPNIVHSSVCHKRSTYAKVWIEENDQLQDERKDTV